ncbi:hypothetical protein [Massilia glaciei]|nr:hypothetical protein [Massilia glaciei]
MLSGHDRKTLNLSGYVLARGQVVMAGSARQLSGGAGLVASYLS